MTQLCCVSDEEIAEAIEKNKREFREGYLAEHPECVDVELVTTGYERDGGYVDVTVQVVPLREPKMYNMKGVRIESRTETDD